jgi:hypothetical protein
MTVEELKNLLDEFLKRWNLDEVQKITLHDYVGLGNKDTFCQWVETKTRPLGSIKGLTSIKFGIYERKDQEKYPQKYKNDEKYSWLQKYGENREQAFENVKKDLMKIIDASEKGNFSSIDDLLLPDLFKWKVAFLYSNERLIPIYKKDILFKIAENLGLKTNKKTQVSEIQDIMMQSKPAHLSVYEYMRQLYDKFGGEIEKEERSDSEPKLENLRTRKPAENKNINSQVRTIARSYIVEQKHNKLQEALKEKLIEKFGKANVLIEENYVDIKLLQPNRITFYEVKSSPYPSDCIREAIGQLLSYTFYDTDRRIKRLIVVGQYPPNNSDKGFIQFIKDQLKVDFEYENIDIT